MGILVSGSLVQTYLSQDFGHWPVLLGEQNGL
jgi:hypothetical protein